MPVPVVMMSRMMGLLYHPGWEERRPLTLGGAREAELTRTMVRDAYADLLRAPKLISLPASRILLLLLELQGSRVFPTRFDPLPRAEALSRWVHASSTLAPHLTLFLPHSVQHARPDPRRRARGSEHRHHRVPRPKRSGGQPLQRHVQLHSWCSRSVKVSRL